MKKRESLRRLFFYGCQRKGFLHGQWRWHRFGGGTFFNWFNTMFERSIL